MNSPFPGMDPFLEARWSDVHVTLIGDVKEALQPSLPRGLRARSEEQILLEDETDEAVERYRADVVVVESPRGGAGASSGAALIEAEPYVVEFESGPQIERWVQIIDVTNGNRVITAIEILSPWNKRAGRLNAEYRRKLDSYGRGGVSVVEIDLLRSSRSRLSVVESDLPLERRTPYFACVRRAWLPRRWEVYSIGFRTPIPPVRVPLRQSDADVVLQLQPLIERVYAAGGHDDIDYSKPPEPPLTGEDAAWADQLLREKKMR
jgi:hypothetical protein